MVNVVDPDLQAALAAQDARWGPPPSLDDPIARRRHYDLTGSVLHTTAASAVCSEDLWCVEAGHEIALRVYTPPGVASSGPAIVYLHGGGWMYGSLNSHDALCRELTLLTGFRMVAVHYRRTPENPWPAPLADSLRAWLHVRAQATALGIDAEQLLLAGDSSGGHLALAVSQALQHSHLPPPRALGLLYPVVDPACQQASYTEFAEGYGLTAAAMRTFWGALHPAAASSGDDRLNPLLAAAIPQGPPLVMLLAELDVLRDEGRLLAARYRAQGRKVWLEETPGMLHGFARYHAKVPAASQALARWASALRQTAEP
jgi:acetyl esterase